MENPEAEMISQQYSRIMVATLGFLTQSFTPLKMNHSSFADNINKEIRSGPQDQKSVIFLHSVISLNQLVLNSKHTANIFLTFRNNVKIFLSQNIMHNF